MFLSLVLAYVVIIYIIFGLRATLVLSYVVDQGLLDPKLLINYIECHFRNLLYMYISLSVGVLDLILFFGFNENSVLELMGSFFIRWTQREQNYIILYCYYF